MFKIVISSKINSLAEYSKHEWLCD